VDPAVGLLVRRRLGDRVERGEVLCTVFEVEWSEAREQVTARLQAAFRIGAGPVAPPPLVLEAPGGSEVRP
jgi:thymidine phosphorylase